APATTVGASVILGGLVLSACLWRVSIDELPRGPLVIAYNAYGWAAGAAVVTLACCAVWRLRIPSAGQGIERPQRPLPTFLGRVAARVTPALVHAYLVVGVFAAAFVVALTVS